MNLSGPYFYDCHFQDVLILDLQIPIVYSFAD
jgi:hypothetical protein